MLIKALMCEVTVHYIGRAVGIFQMLMINPCIHVLVVGTPCPDKLAMVDGHNS